MKQRDGSLRGFYNACGHRAQRLVWDHGAQDKFFCPYHGWVWDLDGIDSMIHDYLSMDLMAPLRRWTGAPIELVRAGRSDRWLPAEISELEALEAEHPVDLHLLSNAGHWVHVDDPHGLLNLMLSHWPT